MKDQYVGDVNDFAKYAVLRSLRDRHQPIAICWMRTSEDARGDGQHLAYLAQADTYRAIDPGLFDRLREIVNLGRRTLESIEESRLLDPAVFFSMPLSDQRGLRERYFERVWAESPPNGLIFFDPDNGLGVSSVSVGRRGSSKYLYAPELLETLAREHLAIVYQHFPRVQRRPFLSRLMHDLELAGRSTFALYTSRVGFLVCGSTTAVDRLRIRANALLQRSNGFIAYQGPSGPRDTPGTGR